MTFTKEQKDILIKTADYMIKRENTSDYSENIRKVAEIALAVLTAEPVAWMARDIDTGEKVIRSDRSYFEGSCQPLYTAPPAPVVPDEIEPTSGSDFDDYYCDGWNACRAVMLRGGKS